jgi:hypothetical protein
VVRDWNAEYQGTLERMKSAASDQLACMVQLRDLAEDFVETAERYGRIIVSERHVSNELKTVKPAALGGVAGGEKFVVHGILFKFALDQRIPASSSSALPQWMYGGSAPNDENAMRAAGHELKGVIAMSKCHVDDLCLPLMCLIDYLGFRLVAMSSLPISRRSIVYGSCDGASIHADDDDVNAMIATVARKLNLAPHLVADRTLHVAGDIEAHRGADGRAYVIDLARLMPPEAPDDATNDPRAVFHRLLRAEHVRSADAPLSSDAFTNFQRYDRRAPELNAAVRRETVRLFEQVVPRVAAALCQHVRRGSSLPPNAPRHPRRALTTNSGLLAHDTASSGLSPPSSPSPHSAASPRGGSFIMSPMRDDDDERELLTASQRTSALSGEQLVEILHQHGVNLRHCGRVRRAVVALGESSNDAAETAAAALVQRVLLSEMCARVVKKRLESGWRRLATTALSIQPHRRLVLSEFNRVFGPSLEATSHWRDYAVASMKFELHRKFRDCLTTAELLTAYDLRHAVDVPLMFWRLQRMTGITMSARARRELATSLQFTFVEPDVEQLHATTKHSNLVVHVSGVVLAMQAAAMPSAGAEFDRLFAIAVEKFRKALHSVPDDVSTQFQFAKLVHVRAKLQSDMELFAEARERYDAALRVDAEFAPAQLALSLLELDRLAVRAIEWRARAVIMAAASEHQSNHDVLRQSRRVVAFPLASADVERLFDACSERARVAIAASSRTDGLRAEARNAAAAFIALERSLMPQTNDVYVRPLMRRAAADVALGSGAALLGALVAAPEPSRQQQLHTSATSSSSTDDSDAARVVQRDADARRLSFVCCRWALAYLCSADLSLSTALQLIEHAGRRLQTAANAEPTQLLAWLGPMAYDDAALIAFAHIAATSCSVLQEAVRERLQYVEEVYVDRCVALPASLLASSLVQCARLRVLSLRGCFQANDALLIALVRSLPTLRMLDLSQCVTLTPDAIVVVANSLPQLRGIVLDRCDLIDNTSVRQLALRCTSLQYLSLARTRGSPSLADHALEPVAALTDLRFLAIDHHYLLSERTVCTVLSACRRIRCLRADGCTKLTSRGLLNAIGRRASSFALAFDSFRDSIGRIAAARLATRWTRSCQQLWRQQQVAAVGHRCRCRRDGCCCCGGGIDIAEPRASLRQSRGQRQECGVSTCAPVQPDDG